MRLVAFLWCLYFCAVFWVFPDACCFTVVMMFLVSFFFCFCVQSKVSQDKAASKREERLVMSSVYELGMDIIERQLKSSVSYLL